MGPTRCIPKSHLAQSTSNPALLPISLSMFMRQCMRLPWCPCGCPFHLSQESTLHSTCILFVTYSSAQVFNCQSIPKSHIFIRQYVLSGCVRNCWWLRLPLSLCGCIQLPMTWSANNFIRRWIHGQCGWEVQSPMSSSLCPSDHILVHVCVQLGRGWAASVQVCSSFDGPFCPVPKKEPTARPCLQPPLCPAGHVFFHQGVEF